MRNMNKNLLITIQYILTIIFTLILLGIFLEIWNSDMKIPFSFSGDTAWTAITIKGIAENGWYLTNNDLGAPVGMNLRDFPISDNLHIFLIKIISIFTSNWGQIINSYYILTFPLTAVTTLVVLKRYNIANFIAITLSLVYAFMPYHFLRGQVHLFLASYYMIPLMVMVILDVFKGNMCLLKFDEVQKRNRIDIKNKKVISYIIICLLCSSSGVYYPFFACFLLSIVSAAVLIDGKRMKNFITSIVLICCIVIGTLINILPSILYQIENGKNKEVAIRIPTDSEHFGMKITQLFIPKSDHNIGLLKQLVDGYKRFPLGNEATEYLGIIGGIGFLILLFGLFRSKYVNQNEIFYQVSLLNIGSILLITIGGFSTMFAIAISSQIRAYNRFSIYIAFFSILAFGLVLNDIFNKFNKNTIFKYSFITMFAIFSLLCLFEQTDRISIPAYQPIKEEYNINKKFVEKIEKKLPKESMIFQLPYVSFPENPPVNKMVDYDHFKVALFSKNLKWSYGVMKGRKGAEKIKEISQLQTDALIEKVKELGFRAIYIDRFGYSDNAEKLEREINEIYKISPIVSQDNRKTLYILTK